MRADGSGGQAVVLGAGIAGLLAAAALADAHDRVTVIDRDALPDDGASRRGVPQGRQVHGLESRGVQAIERLLPGLVAELVAEGASLIDDLSRMHYRVDGVRITCRPTPIHPFLLVGRPFLERAVRRRVTSLPGVAIRDRLEVARLRHVSSGRRQRVTGVTVTPAGGGPAEDLGADLVVDATGRGSRMPLWLGELGHPRPDEDVIPVGVSYATRVLRMPDRLDDAGLPPFLIEGTARPGAAGITLFRCEQGRTVFGVSGPREIFPVRVGGEWMLQVAGERLPAPVRDAVAGASAAPDAGPVAVHHVPSSVWRRYDRMSRFPAGLLVLGDALCAVNPVYGQGMSVAAAQALALRKLVQQSGSGLDPAEFFAAAKQPARQAWRLTSGPDEAHAGGANAVQRVGLWGTGLLLAQAFRVAERDAQVARVLTGVTGLSEPRRALLHPRVLTPVVASGGVLAARRLVSRRPRPGGSSSGGEPDHAVGGVRSPSI